MMMTRLGTLACVAVVVACGQRDAVPCERDSNCDLATGGVCTDSGAHRWCAYPAQDCPGGLRYSDQAVGDGVSGTCVIAPDAGIDDLPDWFVAHGGSGDDLGTDLAAAPNGDLVAVGGLTGTISLGGDALTGGPGWVARYRADGAHFWSRTVGSGASADRVAVDGHGDVYVAGVIVTAADFGGGVRTAPLGAYIVKLAGADGHYLWDRVIPNAMGRQLNVLALQPTGDAVAACGVFSDADLGNGVVHAAGDADNFVAVYDGTAGGYRWARPLTSSDQDNGVCSLAIVGTDLVVAADLVGAANLGGDALPALGLADVGIARYHAADGSHVWSLRHGSAGASVFPSKLVTDGTRLVVGGVFDFANVNLGGSDLALAAGATNGGFVAAYDATDGHHLWSEPLGDQVQGLAITATQLTAATDFHGTITLGAASLTALGNNRDVALASLAPDTGAPGVTLADLGGSVEGATASLAQLIATGDRLAGLGTFTGSIQLKRLPARATGGRDIFAFRVAF